MGRGTPDYTIDEAAGTPTASVAEGDLLTDAEHDARDHSSVTGVGDQVTTARQAVTVPAGGVSNEVVTWATAFPDTNYTAVVIVLHTDAEDGLQVMKLQGQAAESVNVRVKNNNGISERSGTLHAIAVAD